MAAALDKRESRVKSQLTVAHVALLLPWVMAVIAARLPIGDNSFLWHVRAGSAQLDRGSVLTGDPFSFTFQGSAWRTQSWLLDLGYGLLDRIVGLGFVPWLLGVTTALTFGLILIAVHRRTKSVEATALIGVATAWLASIYLNPRPVLLSYLLLAMVVVAAGDRRLRWGLPLVGWIWASVHGSFILGIGYVALDGVRHRDRRTAIDIVAMTTAATAGAHGLAVWQILLEFLRGRGALNLITEWGTPNFTSVESLPFLVGIVLLVAGGLKGHLRPRDLWIAAPFLALSMTAARSVYPGWIALAPLIGTGLASLPRASRGSRSTNRVLWAAMGLVFLFPFLIPVTPGLSERFPIEAARHLTSNRVFHDDVTGGYLIYATWPDRRVFVDDRAELYGEDFLRQAVEAWNGTPTWRHVFQRWGIQEALLRPENGLVAALSGAGWYETYRDEEFVILRP